MPVRPVVPDGDFPRVINPEEDLIKGGHAESFRDVMVVDNYPAWSSVSLNPLKGSSG